MLPMPSDTNRADATIPSLRSMSPTSAFRTVAAVALAAGSLLHSFAAGATWVDARRTGDIAYFAVDNPSELRRFDLANEKWLPALSLAARPTALMADNGAVYLATGNTTVRYPADLTGGTPVLTTAEPVTAIVGNAQYVYLVRAGYPYGRIASVRRSDNTAVTEAEYLYKAFVGASISVPLGRMYGRDTGLSPADIDILELKADGTFGTAQDSPYHGAYPGATRTFVLADGLRVADDSGTVYTGDNLTYAGSFGGRIDGIDFKADGTPIVLRGTNVISFSKAYLPTGSAPVTLAAPSGLFVRDTNVFVFGISGADIAVQRIPVSTIRPPDPGPAVDPKGLAYTPDDILADRNGDLLLNSQAQRSLFRWSRSGRAYSPTIPLVEAAPYVAYSPALHRVYLGHASGRIDHIPLDGEPKQAAIANAGAAVLGLAVAGQHLFACAAISPWVSHQTFTTDGTLIESKPWNYFSRQYIWSPSNRTLYHFRDDTSPNDLLREAIGTDGRFGAQVDSPYHGEVATVHPIRVSPDARAVLLGSGELYDGTSLVKAGNLAVTVADAAWWGQDLFTVRSVNGAAVVQKWSTNNYTATAVLQVTGSPLRLFADAQGLTLVTLQASMPRFHLIDSALGLLYSSPIPPAAPDGLAAAEITPDSITLAWNDRSDNEDVFEVERQDASTGKWSAIGTAPANSTGFRVTGLAFATTNTFRVRAANAAGSSAYAGPVSAKTFPDPRIAPPASDLAVVEVLGTRVELVWRDNASNEDGFRLQRRDGATPGPWKTVATLAANATTTVDTALTPLTRYEYRVVAFNAFADSEPGNSVVATTQRADGIPPTAAPTGLRVLAADAASVSLVWVDTTSNESGFAVERSTYPPTTWAVVGTVGRNTISFVDTAVAPASRYSYRVSATNAFGKATQSGFIDGTTKSVGGDYLGVTARAGDVTLFAFSSPNRLERFDTKARKWLDPLPLPDVATALFAAPDATYVAVGRQVFRLGAPGEPMVPLMALSSAVQTLFVSGDFLYAVGVANDIVWANRRTGILGGQGGFGFYSIQPGISFAADGRTFYAVTRNVSPADILRYTVPEAGGIPTGKDSPYHGTYPGGLFAAVFPDGKRVATSAGIVYSTADLTYAGSLAGAFDTLCFTADGVPVVARGRTLVAYGSTLLEVGRTDLDATPSRLDVSGGDLLAYVPDPSSPRGFAVRTVPLADFVPPDAGLPPALAGLAFTPDGAFLADADDTLVLVSKQYQTLFRWSVAARAELPSIALSGAPSWVAYSKTLNRAFTAYASGKIMSVDLVEGAVEKPFANLPGPALGLACLGDLVFAADGSGAWATHYIFRPDGSLVTSREWNYISREYTWNEATRRVYFFRDSMSPNDLHWESVGADGSITAAGETPYHGEVNCQPPIRVKPDGSRVLIGSGQVFETGGLTFSGGLPYGIADAGWSGTTLVTLRDAAGTSQVQRWSASYTATATVQLTGTPLRLWPLGTSATLVLTLDNAQPRMTLLDSGLNIAFQSPVNHAPTGISVDPAGVPENAPAGTRVGSLAAADPDAGDTARFAIVGGAASAFRVAGDQLFTTQPFNFEQAPKVTLQLMATDRRGLSFTQSLVITITNVNEPPAGIALSNQSVREEAPFGTLVGLVSAADPDQGDTLAFTLVDDAGGSFRLVGNRLETARALSFRDAPRPTVRIRATDTAGATAEAALAVTVVELPPPAFTTHVVGSGTDQLLWTDVVLPRLGFGMQYQADTSTDLREWTPLLIPPIQIGTSSQADTLRYVMPAPGPTRFLRIRRVYP